MSSSGSASPLNPPVHEAQLERDLIEEDPAILGGVPVFKGTRIPVALIADLVSAGLSFTALVEDYPTLTRAMFNAAATHQAIRHHPGSLSQGKIGWKLKSRKVVKPRKP